MTRAIDAVKRTELRELDDEIARAEARLLVVDELRDEIHSAASLPLGAQDPTLSERWFREVTGLIVETQAIWIELDRQVYDVDGRSVLHTRFKHLIRIITEYGGRQDALIGRLIAQGGSPTEVEQAELLEWHGRVEQAWELTDVLSRQSGLAPRVTPYLEDARSHFQTVFDMVAETFYTPGARPTRYPIGVELWLELNTQARDTLYLLREAALAEIRDHAASLEHAALLQMGLHGGVLLIAIALCLWSFRVLSVRVLYPIRSMIEALVRASQGPVVTLPPVGLDDRDEIGRLEHVLKVFQRNAAEIEQHARELKEYAEALEHSNKELDDFAYIASHDLKEPLRGIHNHARFLLEDNEGKLDDDSTKRLHRLTYLSQRMERLVNDLLYFSRLGRQDLAIQSTNLNAVVHDIESTLETLLEERHARILVPELLPTVTCDGTRVTELIRNLITNAIKYNDKDEKTVEIGFLPEKVLADGTVEKSVFYVADNGVGIAPEFHDEVFRIFKRLQTDHGDKQEGTGVGLTFVKKIVERHGGRIWLESTQGQGTTFFFTLGGHGHGISR